ncbi:MAG: hypothetical protein ACJAYA_001133 [Bacteroidia bacterium]
MNTGKNYNWVYLLVGVGYLWLSWNFLFQESSGLNICMFKHATGFACPSCGSTRSVLSILEGNFDAALMMNPLGFLGSFALIVVPVLGIAGRWRKRNLLGEALSRLEVFARQPRIALPLIAIVLCNWAWNIYKGL